MSKAGKSEDMFRSQSGYYTEFRKPYPERIFDLIRENFRAEPKDVLLDVGCGTGQIALPLSRDFDRVVGVDLSQEMVVAARRNAAELGIDNAEFRAMRGEDISSLAVEFGLVTYGSALHWMDIPATLAASYGLLSEGGGVAVLGMRSIWGGDSNWELAVVRVVQKWMGQDRRAGETTFSASTQADVRFEDALADAGFEVFDSGSVEASYTVDVDFIIGHLYSTSYCNRELLADRVGEFEQELVAALLENSADGSFLWSPGASYIFARKARQGFS